MSENKLQLFKDTRAANRKKGSTPILRSLNKSKMGYRDDSPYKDENFIDIHTPNGIIDMSETGIPLMANGKILPPYSGKHQFDTNVVREQPVHQMPDGSWMPGAKHGDYYDGGEVMELDDAEIARYRKMGYRVEEIQ